MEAAIVYRGYNGIVERNGHYCGVCGAFGVLGL